MYLTESNSHILYERKKSLKLHRKQISGKPRYYTPTAYSSIPKSDPTKVSRFIKNEDLVPQEVKVKKLVK